MGRSSIPRETIVCIERIVLDESDADRGEYLTISKLRELLMHHYGIDVSKETVADCLETLASETLGLPRNVPDRADSPLAPSYELISLAGEKTNSPKRFAVKRLYSIGQIKHLIRHLRHDDPGISALEAEHLLFKLANKSTREEFNDDLYISDPFSDDDVRAKDGGMPSNAAALRNLLAKVELLDAAIREGMKVRFRVATGPSDQRKNPRSEEWVPYLVAPSDGYYYLFVRPQGKQSKYDVIPYRLDTLIDLESTDVPVEDRTAYEQEREIAKRIFRAGIGRWFSRSTTDIATTVVAFSRRACEDEKKQRYLFEALRDKKGFEPVGTTADGRPQFRFEASRQAMEMWAYKMADLFEVIDPKPVREAVIEKLREAAVRSAYADTSQKEPADD